MSLLSRTTWHELAKLPALVLASTVLLTHPATALEKVTFLLAAPPTLPAFAPLVIAKHLGYFSKAGYEVDFQTARGGIDIAKQVGAGNAPFGLSLADAPIVVRGNGVPIKDVATLGGGALGVLVARGDRGINKIEDFRGKKISVMSFQEANYYAAVSALAAHGMSKQDTEIEAVGPAGVINLVIAGTVDACICTPDWQINVEDAVGKIVAFPLKNFVPTTAQGIVASDDMIAKRPDFVRAIVQASLHGMKDIMDNPEQAAKTFAAAVPSYAGKEAMVARMLKNYVELTFKGQKVLGETDPATLAGLQKLYLEQGVIRTAVPIDSLYTNQFVQ
jgi:NitT/TauT family transport system substrate-binding protein